MLYWCYFVFVFFVESVVLNGESLLRTETDPLPKTEAPRLLSDELPLCRDTEYTVGRWEGYIKDEETRKKSFVCVDCSEEEVELQQLQEGTEKIDICADDSSSQDYSYHDGLHFREFSSGCACSHASKENIHQILPHERYEWVPSNCRLEEFDAHKFCSLLGHRTVMLIGDSTMHQTANTLMFLIKHQNATCSAQIIFALSYTLSGKGTTHPFTYHTNSGSRPDGIDFQTDSILSYPDIVVLNVGAHAEDWGDLNYIWEIWDLKGMIRREMEGAGRNSTFIWKTQNPGHVNCTTIFEPLKEPQQIDKNDPKDTFKWSEFLGYDELNVNNAKELGMKIIDMSPLYYRADAHPSVSKLLLHKKTEHDCLHYCIPGPLNLFAVILMNMLQTGEIPRI